MTDPQYKPWTLQLAEASGVTLVLDVITHPCRENQVLLLPQGGYLWMLWVSSPWVDGCLCIWHVLF